MHNMIDLEELNLLVVLCMWQQKSKFLHRDVTRNQADLTRDNNREETIKKKKVASDRKIK